MAAITRNEFIDKEVKTFYTNGSEERFFNVYPKKFRTLYHSWNGVKWEFNFFRGENVSDISCHSSVKYLLTWIIQLNTRRDFLCNFACTFLHHPICIKEDELSHSMDIIIV